MIAVYVNDEGNTATLSEKGSVRIYRKEKESWNTVREIPFSLKNIKDITEIRLAIVELISQIKECNVFVAKEVVGQLYYVLEANSFESYEAEGRPEVFLDSVQEAVKRTAEHKAVTVESKPISYIEKTDQEGFFFLNLRKVLNQNQAISSKKLLLPFLHERKFQVLDIVCDHLPRWLQSEVEVLDLKAEIVKVKDNEYKVRIYNPRA